MVGFGIAVTGRSPDEISWRTVVWSIASGLVTMGAYTLDPVRSNPESRDTEVETNERN